VRLPGRFCASVLSALLWLPGADAREIEAEVLAPKDVTLVWTSAQHLAEAGANGDPTLVVTDASARATVPGPLGLRILPLHDLAREVPELTVLQLPFFFPDLASVHRAQDGELGAALREAARARGWEILALWDEGLHVMSGNLPYTHPRALQGKEFVLLRDDPIAEMELRALAVWSRRVTPHSLARLHTECVVSSRSATLRQIRSEQLARVHLDLTLSRHRYEGWVVAMRSETWGRLDQEERAGLIERLAGMRDWQRERARQEEDAALNELLRDGMTAHPLPASLWSTYGAMQPSWEGFLPAALTPDSRARLVALAAAAAGIDGGGAAGEALPDAQAQAPKGKP
jgi:TRAP-type C4-dicarboxylate transport system substrate-binding protein